MNTHDIETVLRSFLTGDGYIAADDIPAICATIEADRKRRGKPVKVPSDDALDDALSNLEHDNYEQSYSGYKNRQADIGLIRAAIEADRKHRFENGKALRRYKECGGDEEKDPIERLRFYCSLAMSGQDWLDVQPFFDDLVADHQRRIEGDGE